MINIKKRKFSEQDDQFIIEHYYDMTSSEIAKIIGCSRQQVLKIWMVNGLSGKEHRSYYFNFNYFNKIDTSNKAYIIGLIASDGTLYKRKGHQGLVSIQLHKNDEEILKKISNELNYNKPLNYTKNYCSLTLTSDILYNDLIKVGLYDKKTYTINMNQIKVPNEYLFDYIRGYFDGDGSIFKSLQKSCKNITPCCYNISITGFVHNLKSIQEFLKENEINSQIIIDKRKTILEFGNLKFGSNKDKYLFLKSIYQNNELCIKRKFDIAKEFIEIIEDNKKYNY